MKEVLAILDILSEFEQAHYASGRQLVGQSLTSDRYSTYSVIDEVEVYNHVSTLSRGRGTNNGQKASP